MAAVEANRITSPFIPMIDPKDQSWCAEVKNFLNGYYYNGPIRYEKLTIGRHAGACRYEEKIEESPQERLALKVALFFTGIVPILAGLFLVGNWIDRNWHYYSYISAPKASEATLMPSPPPVPQKRYTIPEEKNLPFSAFFALFIPNRRLFGEYTAEDWIAIIAEYRKYLSDSQKFFQEIILLKLKLLQWSPERLEKPLNIPKETFVESQVPELLTHSLAELGIEKLKDEKEIELAIDSLVCQRLNYFLAQSIPISKEAMQDFIDAHLAVGTPDRFIKHAAQSASANHCAALAEVFKQRNVDTCYRLFLEELLQAKKPQKIASAFSVFWDLLETKVGAVINHYQATFWVHLLAFIRPEDMPHILATVLATLPDTDKKYLINTTLDFWALRSHHPNFEALKEQAKGMIRQTPQLASLLPDGY